MVCCLPLVGSSQPRTAEVTQFNEPGNRPLSQEPEDWVLFVNALTSQTKNSWSSYLASEDFDISVRNGIGRTMLHHTAMLGNLKATQELLKAGVDPNLVDSLYGHTPLHEAVLKGFTDVADALVKAGAKLNARGRDGSTPLHIAAGSEQDALVTFLLKAGANVNARDKENITPLHCAVAAGSIAITTQLLDAGALPDLKSLETWDMAGDTTPLHIAAEQGNLELVILLAERGANLSLANLDGQTPLSLAIKGRHAQVVQYLRSKGAR